MNSAKVRQILEQFNTAYHQLDQGYDFRGFPSTRKQGTSVTSLLLIQSIYSTSLDDFKTRITGLMPLSVQQELLQSLHSLQPFYERFIWKPSLKKLISKKERLEQLVKHANLNHIFNQAVKFYRSTWPENHAFAISLYPIPGKRGNTAESLNGVESVGVLTEATDDEENFGILFHEICHTLYAGESPEVQIEFEKWFSLPRNPFGLFTYYRIDEALATALGNGLAFERAAGHLDKSSWYNEKYIEGLAKGIYGKVKDYFEADRSIDETFVNHAVAIFKAKFPEAPLEYDNLFFHVLILLDSEVFEQSEIRDRMNKHFRISSRSMYENVDDKEGLEELRHSSDTTLVFVSSTSVSRLDTIAAVIPNIVKFLPELKKNSMPYLFRLEINPGRNLFVVAAKRTNEILLMIDAMKRVGKIQVDSPFQRIP